MNDDHTAKIRELNDTFRLDPASPRIPGKVVMTQGINAFSPEEQLHIFNRVRCFDDFTESNDPYGEHDFGSFTFNGGKIFWKIDYYDPDCHKGSIDPANPEETMRVLTIMMASEY